MRPAALVLVAVSIAHAGCNDGVVIEVRPPPGTDVTQVELFLGLERCHDCPGIKPELARGLLTGEVYFRDDTDNTKVFTGPVVDGKATFKILPSDVGHDLHVVAAVGYASPQGVPNSGALLTSITLDRGPEHYILQLAPAGSGLRPVTPSNGVFVDLWQQKLAPMAKCLGFERWKDGQLAHRAFVVPEADPDCDDLVEGDLECNPLAHDGASRPQLENLSCARLDDDNACRLGGAGCVDGLGPSACVPSNYCVPTALCTDPSTGCTTAATAQELLACFGRTPISVPSLRCRFPMRKDNSTETHLEVCSTTSLTLDLDVHVGTECVDGEKKMLLQVAPDDSPLAFAEAITVNTSSMAAGQRALMLTMKRETDCRYRVEWSGEAGLVYEPRRTFVRFTTAPVGGSSTHLVLPLELELVDSLDCTTEPTCSVVDLANPTGDLFACAQP